MEYYLYLLQVFGIANPRTLNIVNKFGSAANVFERIKDGDHSFLKPNEAARRSSLDESFRIMEFCADNGCRIITYFDADYPENLKNIFNPPLVLFVMGSLKPLNEQICINVIGKRKPSGYALRAAAEICGSLAEIGTVIISGFAVGVDVAAMSSAIRSGGITAGVLACGIDADYPRGSKEFRLETANSGGAVITECLPGTCANRASFQIRNRIMSGLAQGTLIIEAGEQSGCHITASHAINQNRDLFCVPPCNIFDSETTGVVRYLRDGAIPVFDYTDIVNSYQMYYGQMLVDFRQNPGTERVAPETEKKPEPKPPAKPLMTARFISGKNSVEIISPNAPVIPEVLPEKIPAAKRAEITATLSPECKEIYTLFESERKTLAIDDVIAKTALPVDAVNVALFDLEVEGLLEPAGGSRYKFCGV